MRNRLCLNYRRSRCICHGDSARQTTWIAVERAAEIHVSLALLDPEERSVELGGFDNCDMLQGHSAEVTI
jgi:hypothetical protein